MNIKGSTELHCNKISEAHYRDFQACSVNREFPIVVKHSGECNNPILKQYGYDIIKKIGSGTYSKVILAESKRQQKPVAIKIITKASLPQSLLDKFVPREINVVKTLKHENILQYFRCLETSHRFYIVMQYAKYGTLLDLIKREGYLDVNRARIFFKQLISVLDYCHLHNVAHRDVKCENLLLCSANKIKLCDFSFAKFIKEAGKDAALSRTFCGSYAYASPEILRGIPYQPQTADIWAAGVVLFAMVFGKMPYDDSNFRELLMQVERKVDFPKEPPVDYNCKNLIVQILSPIKIRATMEKIKNHPWFVLDLN